MSERKEKNFIFSDSCRRGQKKTCLTAAFIAVLFIASVLFSGCGGISLDPDDSGSYDEGIRAVENAEYDKALAKLQEAADTDGRLAESYRAQGIALYEKGSYKQAEQMLALSLENMHVINNEFTEDVNYYRAECLTKMGETIQAQALYEDLADGLRPYLAHAMLGKIFMGQGKKDKAGLYFDMAVEENPDYAVYLMIYDACKEALLEADGTAYLEKALELEPEDARDHANLGRIYECLEQEENAIIHLQTAVDAGYVEAVSILGDIYLEDGNISAARALYENEIKNNSWPADGYNGLALCELAQGKADEALQYIEEGLRYEDESRKKSLLFNEVIAYETQRDFDTALQKANEFLLYYPNDDQMKKEQKFLST